MESQIKRGELSLSVAAEIGGVARREKLSEVATEQLVRDLAGASKREAERKLASLFPEAPRPKKARSVSEELVEIRFTVTREEAALLEELLDKTAHTNYARSYKQAFLDLACKALQKKAAPLLGPGQVRSRHIPAQVRRAVWQRDQARCQYQDPRTKHQCNSRHGLQLDHIQPYAAGGAHTPENLRLYCGAHNRFRSSS